MKRLIDIVLAWWRKSAPAVPCPYCPNPDRDSIYDGWQGCEWWKSPYPQGGGDPPCVCDGYGTKKQLRQLGLAR